MGETSDQHEAASSVAGLLDVPLDALRNITALLPVADLLSLCSTCSSLRSLAHIEAVWAQQCERWLEEQGAGVGVQRLQHALGLDRDARATYQVLHRLRSWPVGLWHSSPDDEGQQPRGRLMLVSACGGSLSISQVLGGPTTQQAATEELVRLRVERSDGVVQLVAESHHPNYPPVLALSLSRDDQQLALVRGVRAISLLAVREEQRVVPFIEEAGGSSSDSGKSSPRSPRSWVGGLMRMRAAEPANWSFRRVVLQPPPAPREEDPPGLSILRALQGLWSALYSVHGWEVLRCSVGDAGTPPPPGCTITGPRLEGFKLVGDPNVFANRHSFVVDAVRCRLGRYDPQEDDPFPENGHPRPIVAFHGAGVAVMVHLAARPVAARFSAVGQINRVQGVWRPEWTTATLITYEPAAQAVPTFSLIFEDEGEPFRHIMDFRPLPLQPPGSALRQLPGSAGEHWAAAWQERLVGSAGREDP